MTIKVYLGSDLHYSFVLNSKACEWLHNYLEKIRETPHFDIFNCLKAIKQMQLNYWAVWKIHF